MPLIDIQRRVEREPTPGSQRPATATTHQRSRRERRIWARALLGAVVCLMLSASTASAALVMESGSGGAPGTPDGGTTLIGNPTWVTTAQPASSPLNSLGGAYGGAKWISHSAGALSQPPLPVTYRYTRKFTVPDCATGATVSGVAIADDTVDVRLNGPSLGTAGYNTTKSFTAAPVLLGPNTLTFIVTDTNVGITALAYKATVTWQGCASTGMVSVCKVAGPGVTPGTPYTFTTGSPAQTVTVPAYPLPSAVCTPFPNPIPFGTTTVSEVGKPGNAVTGIKVSPASQLVSSNLPGGSAVVDVGSGVTEITFTNEAQLGLVKVCKVAGPGVPLGTMFTFKLGSQTVMVPAGSPPNGLCKPFPNSVNYGPTTITESPLTGYALTKVHALPSNRFVSANFAAGIGVVNVGSGVTEAVFTNVGYGYMEVCKETIPVNPGTQPFTFTVTGADGVSQTVVVPGGGTCSPPILLPAGPVKVVEGGLSGWTMTTSCKTLPFPPLISFTCTPSTLTATTTITAGDESKQVLLYFRNCQNPPGHVNHCLIDDGGVVGPFESDPKVVVVKKFPGRAKVIDASPDPSGKTVYSIVKLPHKAPAIVAVPTRGGPKRQVLAGKPLGTPTALAVSDDGKQLFVADKQAGNVLVVPVSGDAPHVLAGTAGTSPRGLEIQTIDGKERLVFTGKDPADRKPAVLSVSTGGEDKPSLLAKGPQVRKPGAVAIAITGAIYVTDGEGSDGRILRVREARISKVAEGLRLGDHPALALRRDESELVFPTLTRRGKVQLSLKHLATGKVRQIPIAGVNRASGLHRAGKAFELSLAVGTPSSGKLLRINLGGTPKVGKSSKAKGSDKKTG